MQDAKCLIANDTEHATREADHAYWFARCRELLSYDREDGGPTNAEVPRPGRI